MSSSEDYPTMLISSSVTVETRHKEIQKDQRIQFSIILSLLRNLEIQCFRCETIKGETLFENKKDSLLWSCLITHRPTPETSPNIEFYSFTIHKIQIYIDHPTQKHQCWYQIDDELNSQIYVISFFWRYFGIYLF